MKLSWGWRIAIVYTFFASSTVAFVAFAMSTNVDLVRSDYYEYSLQQDKSFAAFERGNSVASEISIEQTATGITIGLPRTHRGSVGTVQLYRPDSPKLDRAAAFVNGTVTIRREQLTAGKYKVILEWSFEKNVYGFERNIDITL
jgi:hypothetical protein